MDFTQLDLDHQQRVLLLAQCLGMTCELLEHYSDQSRLEWATLLARSGNDEVSQRSPVEVEQKLAGIAAFKQLDLQHKQGLLVTTCSLSMGTLLLSTLIGKDYFYLADQLERAAAEVIYQMSHKQVNQAIRMIEQATADQQIVWNVGEI